VIKPKKNPRFITHLKMWQFPYGIEIEFHHPLFAHSKIILSDSVIENYPSMLEDLIKLKR
jgi:hypothetical protein